VTGQQYRADLNGSSPDDGATGEQAAGVALGIGVAEGTGSPLASWAGRTDNST
jgi:hypothetical protein